MYTQIMRTDINHSSSPVLFDYPNPKLNTFLMMRFRDNQINKDLISSLRVALKHYGINLLRADDRSYSETLWANVKAYMDACDFGIAIFEQVDEKNFNPNVSLELGYMLAKNKGVLLLKDLHLTDMPSDILGHLYKTFDSYHISETIPPKVNDWLRDVGIAKSQAERSVLFISYGGTCRCAMAKVATEQVFKERNLPYRLRIESIAYAFGDANEASKGARKAIYESYGKDYLEMHKVTRRSPGVIEDADLILIMEKSFATDLPQNKTFMFNEFFGFSGDVPNPWRSVEDKHTALRYRTCLRHIRDVIDGEADRIITFLSSLNPS